MRILDFLDIEFGAVDIVFGAAGPMGARPAAAGQPFFLVERFRLIVLKTPLGLGIGSAAGSPSSLTEVHIMTEVLQSEADHLFSVQLLDSTSVVRGQW